VLDGKVAAIVQIGNKIVAGRQFTRVASAAAPTTAIARSNIFAFDATTGRSTPRSRRSSTPRSRPWPRPDGLHVFAGGSFTKINGVAQKSLVKLRLRDGARITAFKGKTNARVKDMAVSGWRLYIGGTFKTANGVARSAWPPSTRSPAPSRPTSTSPSPARGTAPSTSTSSTSPRTAAG
jgi:hypothetical protein